MICDFGDVVVVPFPFVDIEVAKRRPSMVLSNEAFNRQNGRTALAMITSALRSTWPSDLGIEDLSPTGLSHASLIRWKIFTLPNALILRRVGVLGTEDRSRAARAAQLHFAPA